MVAAIDRRSREIRKTFLVFAIILVGFPNPIKPLVNTGLDLPWMAGINWATAHHLVFGRDVDFTYGPLGFALFPVDCASESWRWIAVVGQMCLYGFWWLSLSLGLVLAHIDDLEGEILFALSSMLATVRPDGGDVITLTVVGYLAVSFRRNSLALGLLAAFVSGLALFIKFNLGVASIAAVCTWIALIVLGGRGSQRPSRASRRSPRSPRRFWLWAGPVVGDWETSRNSSGIPR